MATIASQLNDLSLKQTPIRKDFLDVTCGWAASKPFDVAKTIEKSVEWIKYFNLIPQGQEAAFKEVHFAAKMAKLSKWPGRLLDSTNAFRHAVVDLYEKPSSVTLTKTFRKFLSVFGPTWDGIDFLSRAIIHWPKEAFQTFQGANGLALSIGMGWGAIENAAIIAASPLHKTDSSKVAKVEEEKIVKVFLVLASQVSYVALGIFSVLGAWFHIIAPAVAFCAASTLTVAFSIIKYYYENLGKEIPLRA